MPSTIVKLFEGEPVPAQFICGMDETIYPISRIREIGIGEKKDMYVAVMQLKDPDEVIMLCESAD